LGIFLTGFVAILIQQLPATIIGFSSECPINQGLVYLATPVRLAQPCDARGQFRIVGEKPLEGSD